MTSGDTFTAAVETLAYGGDGIARTDGRVIFIPETVPGETVRVRIRQLKKNFARAEMLEILKPSSRRIVPCCRVADPATGAQVRVPGCVYDHLDYAAEVDAKQRQLEGFIRRLPDCGGVPFESPFASPAPLHYRNKIVLHVQREQGRMRLGYRQEPSHRVLDVPACPLACDEINEALSALRAAAQAWKDGTRVTFRHTVCDGTAWWPDGEEAPAPCAGLLTEASPVGPLRVPRDGFYQVNPAVGNALVRTVAAWFAENRSAPELFDLYCGVGIFGFACMKAGGEHLSGIESGTGAVAAARQNAQTLGLPAEFQCRVLGQEAADLRAFIRAPARTTTIVDPPRDGLAPDVARALAASGTPRMFYVSCDPATLARDLAVLLRSGYRVRRVQLFDMFPRTAHFESLVELSLG